MGVIPCPLHVLQTKPVNFHTNIKHCFSYAYTMVNVERAKLNDSLTKKKCLQRLSANNTGKQVLFFSLNILRLLLFQNSKHNLSRDMRKPTMWFLTRSDTNQAFTVKLICVFGICRLLVFS